MKGAGLRAATYKNQRLRPSAQAVYGTKGLILFYPNHSHGPLSRYRLPLPPEWTVSVDAPEGALRQSTAAKGTRLSVGLYSFCQMKLVFSVQFPFFSISY
jgi:hypothetical protein